MSSITDLSRQADSAAAILAAAILVVVDFFKRFIPAAGDSGAIFKGLRRP